MARDPQDQGTEPQTSMRVAMLELAATGAGQDEAQLLAALRRIVESGRNRAVELFAAYHGGRPDARARIFARHAD